jgi:sporulation protein YlmC with PRC-barrel domain
MRYTRNVPVVGVVALLLLGSTAWGQRALPSREGASSSQRMQRSQQQVHQQMPSTLQVTSADDLIGRAVREAQGREAGQVEYIMIDTQSGDVRYAVIGSGGELDIGNDLIVVPWSAVELKQQALVLNRSLSEIQQAPRLSEDRLVELT